MTIPAYVVYPALAAAVAGALWVVANRQVFHPAKYPAGRWEEQPGLGVEDVWIDTPDGLRLHGWWSEARDAPLVHLFLHGNAGNVSQRGGHIRAVHEAGASILVIDYRGYGRSEGRPSEEGLYRDAEAAYGFLRGKGYEPGRIVAHGQSIGTAVAVELALRAPVGGVILESPFTSAGDVAHRILPYLGPTLVRGFRSSEKIGRLRAPVWILHGEEDDIVGIDMGRALYAAAPEPKSLWAIAGAGHNDIIEVAGAEYVRRLREFHGR